MFASHNEFSNNAHRDALILTFADTITSCLAGITIFGTLGNLAHNLGTDDVGKVVQSGTGLAFISYPDAIAKFEHFPQIFSVLFFLMIATIGIGSCVGLQNAVTTVFQDIWPEIPFWILALIGCTIQFFLGLVYVTPVRDNKCIKKYIKKFFYILFKLGWPLDDLTC